MIKFLKFIFYISVLLLTILSLYPGSVVGYIFYGDLKQQPDLINNPFGTTINHFIAYLYVSLLGFSIHTKHESFKILTYRLFFLSILLEVLQLIVPNRSFEFYDLIGNFLGVLVAYFLVKIYIYLKYNE